jgi:hypothetical protein
MRSKLRPSIAVSVAWFCALGIGAFLLPPKDGRCAEPTSKVQPPTDRSASSARECMESIGAHWDMRALRKWADPSYRNLMDTDNGQTEKMFATVKEKLGDLKIIKSIRPGLHESKKALYYIDADCENAVAKIRLEMVAVENEKKWKLRAINFSSKALALSPVSKETLALMKDYVDTTIPKLGRNWNYEEFKAEADPNLFQTDNALAQKRFGVMTNFIGPVVNYKLSQLAREGVKNGAPIATYKAFFTGNNCEGVALVTVVYRDNRCRIASLNFGKKLSGSQSGGNKAGVAPNTVPGTGLMPGGFLPGPTSLPAGNTMPAPFFDQNPELRGELDKPAAQPPAPASAAQ